MRWNSIKTQIAVNRLRRLPSTPECNRCGLKSTVQFFKRSRGVLPIFSVYLEAFAEFEPLRQRVLAVLSALPNEVQRDFVDDSRFRVTLEDFVPGKGWTLWMASPGPIGSGSRCVVLRPHLAHCSEAFALYVIAHEFAHAYLRNGGWGEITDVEEAADALAASWGFRRPSVRDV